jgi:uncharacterized membrane protein (DUF2068 family)
MSRATKRTKILLAIIIYKWLVFGLLLFTSTTLLLAFKNHDRLLEFTEQYSLSGHRQWIKFFLTKLTNFSPGKIEFTGIAMLIYAVVTMIEAIGLWYQQQWAEILVSVLVGVGIFPELYEIAMGISIVKMMILLINLLVFVYLVFKLIKESK